MTDKEIKNLLIKANDGCSESESKLVEIGLLDQEGCFLVDEYTSEQFKRIDEWYINEFC